MYGIDDHKVTKKMLEQIGVDQGTIESIRAKSFANSVETAKSQYWPLKVLYYADFRTLPSHIGTLEERVSDIRGRMPWYSQRADFEELVEACRAIEKDVQTNLNVSVSDINNKSAPIDRQALETEITV